MEAVTVSVDFQTRRARLPPAREDLVRSREVELLHFGEDEKSDLQHANLPIPRSADSYDIF